MLKGKRVLVTGGAGFIGSNMVDRLLEIGSRVVVLDNFQAGKNENLTGVLDRVELVDGDVRDKNAVKKAISGVDTVFHFAGNASVPNSVDNPEYDFETNACGTFNLLKASLDSGVQKFVFASSAAVYGNPVYTPMDEKHPLHPVSPYGASKLAAERMGIAFKETYGFPFAAIRIFNTFGFRQPRYVIYDFIRKLRQNPKRLEVLGDGNQVRDYCHVSDMVSAFIMVAECGEGVYNAAGGQPISIRELAELIVARISPGAEITYGGKTWKGDINILIADITRLRGLGFEPKVSLKKGEGLEDMLCHL